MKHLMKIILVALLLLPLTTMAQGGKRKEIVDNIRKNVYTRVLVLTEAEGQKFWPVFDKMQGELDENMKEMKKIRFNINENYATLSDAEMEKLMVKMFELEQKALDIRKKYYEEFKKVLPVKKVVLLPRAEREFKKALLDKLKEAGEPPRPDIED